ncbi:MAG: sensor histidine kinase, partial [Novosphingobium sp.]
LAHRVRNLFGVVLSLIGFSSRKSGTTAEVLSDITQRIHALSRAHNMATGDISGDADLGELLDSLGKPYQTADEESAFVCAGAPVTVPARTVTPLALLFHELATNAAKYGALSQPGGRVRITWQDASGGESLRIEWRELGGPPPAAKRSAPSPKGGFGQRMTSAAVQQIGGTLHSEFPPEGAIVVLEIPRAS